MIDFLTIYDSDQHSFQIYLCQMDISTFSRQNNVTKINPKYLLTFIKTDRDSTKLRYIDQAKSNNVQNS